MKLSDLQFEYPENLVAQQPLRPSRVMWVNCSNLNNVNPVEKEMQDLLSAFNSGDVLVVNNTKVLKRRVFAGDLEILFLKNLNHEAGQGQTTNVQLLQKWEVLFPSKKINLGEKIELPLGRVMILEKKGRPQVVSVEPPLDENYFSKVGELPLPPYIQKARQQRHTIDADESWYQTAWAKVQGSFAAPTASLHFSAKDMQQLREKGVKIAEITLHVGLGTFLPVTVEDLDQHEMHSEYVEISTQSWESVLQAKAAGKKVWALGTTATRALESAALGKLPIVASDITNDIVNDIEKTEFKGETNLLIQPGFDWQIVDNLLTNFHQPQSTLLALVAGFAGLDGVKTAYRWAIDRKFRLFSYGDLSVWTK